MLPNRGTKMTPVSAETMRRLDSTASQNGISGLWLMENAGTAIAAKARDLLERTGGKKVAVFCGKGNNGGDGFVAARDLRGRGFHVDLFLSCERREVKNEAAVNLKAYTDSGGIITEIESGAHAEKKCRASKASLIIDALLGTGFSGEVGGIIKSLIESINAAGIPVLSVDVPSGLDATTGGTNPVAVKARWTVSFGLPKKGFYINKGPEHTGELEVINIGFPEGLLTDALRYEEKICAK